MLNDTNLLITLFSILPNRSLHFQKICGTLHKFSITENGIKYSSSLLKNTKKLLNIVW